MESQILDGKLVSKTIKNEVANRVYEYEQTYNEKITLATIIIGNDKASKTYVKMKSKACKEVGINTREYSFPNFTTEGLIKVIEALNQDETINGILIQHPLPKNIDEQKCFDKIAIEKDVDGLSSHNFGKMAFHGKTIGAATPTGIMNILDFYNIDVTGMNATVIGRSSILGKPAALMLLNKDATVTICHSKTKNLQNIVKNSDILIAAIGKPEFIKKTWLKEGVVVIDTGYNYVDGHSVGDVENPKGIASFYTPVPGGVGPVTIATLLNNTLIAAQNQKNKEKINYKGKKYKKEENK